MSGAVDPRASDLEAWTKLVLEAERCLLRPQLATTALELCVDRAFHAVFPAGEASRDNPYNRLLDAARTYARSTYHERTLRGGALGRALDAAAALRDLGTNARPPEISDPPPLPFRRDIDG